MAAVKDFIHGLDCQAYFIYILFFSVTSGLTDMAAVIDYINGLDCEGDRYVAIFLSDFIITGGPATDIQVLQDRLATLTGKGYKVS